MGSGVRVSHSSIGMSDCAFVFTCERVWVHDSLPQMVRFTLLAVGETMTVKFSKCASSTSRHRRIIYEILQVHTCIIYEYMYMYTFRSVPWDIEDHMTKESNPFIYLLWNLKIGWWVGNQPHICLIDVCSVNEESQQCHGSLPPCTVSGTGSEKLDNPALLVTAKDIRRSWHA